jgi:hypothetical protein
MEPAYSSVLATKRDVGQASRRGGTGNMPLSRIAMMDPPANVRYL